MARSDLSGAADEVSLQGGERAAGLLKERFAVALVGDAQVVACLTPGGARVGGKAFCDGFQRGHELRSWGKRDGRRECASAFARIVAEGAG